MFEGIYMGHGAGLDNKTAYTAEAVVELDAGVVVRDGIYTHMNADSSILVTGSAVQSYVATAKVTDFYGNEQTTLSCHNVWVDNAVVDGIGKVDLNDDAVLTMAARSTSLKDVSVKNGACLDFNNVTVAAITGDFTGSASEDLDKEARGILVLNKEGILTIDGTVSGTTQFQTGAKSVAGTIFGDHSYIFASQSSEVDFVLHEAYVQNGFELAYETGAWTVYNNYEGLPVSKIEVVSPPAIIDISSIISSNASIDNESAHFEIYWYDENGVVYDTDMVEEGWLYAYDYVVVIETDAWKSKDSEILLREDWGNSIELVTAVDYPNRYFLKGWDDMQTGAYTFLFCSQFYDTENVITVSDVQALKPIIMAEVEVDGNGKIELADAQIVLKVALKITVL